MMNCELYHEISPNYNYIRMKIVNKKGKVVCGLSLDKKLDVSDKVMKKIEEYHQALRLITDGINDEFIEVDTVQ
ncbi:MAG: hypothetical protein R2685_11090 [Candidatus Nitrosocosmicus sp.]|nr:hypothetical protein [Candidatus Nitrosocosmicus sp.]